MNSKTITALALAAGVLTTASVANDSSATPARSTTAIATPAPASRPIVVAPRLAISEDSPSASALAASDLTLNEARRAALEISIRDAALFRLTLSVPDQRLLESDAGLARVATSSILKASIPPSIATDFDPFAAELRYPAFALQLNFPLHHS